MKILDYLFEEEVTEKRKMSSTTNSQIITKLTSTTPKTLITPITTTMPTQVPSFNEFNKLIEITDELKTYVILIVLAILCVITVRLIKMCTTAYKIHNATIIKNHNRISPSIN